MQRCQTTPKLRDSDPIIHTDIETETITLETTAKTKICGVNLSLVRITARRCHTAATMTRETRGAVPTRLNISGCVCRLDYCTKVSDGRYYDPWNPWCGYIVCRRQQAVRVVCRPGSWMGVSRADSSQLCRRPLVGATCQHDTDLRLCTQPAGLISSQA